MSMSLRDQLLAAGLVSQKQVREAERQQQHQERAQQHSKHKRRPAHQEHGAGKAGHGHGAPAGTPTNLATGNSLSAGMAPASAATSTATAATAGSAAALVGKGHSGAIPSAAARYASAQSAKVARDLALNKKQQEKSEKRARAAQIKQLIEQNRVPRAETDERYNFVDGGRVRFIAANGEIRRRLMAGELFIVRYDVAYAVVPAATAERIRERDERAVINAAAATADSPPADDAYKDFAVPDDLMW